MMKIAQISDTHLFKNPRDLIFGLVNSEDTFLDVLQSVEEEKPDLVLATGDLSQDGSIASYQRLHSYLKRLKCEVYTIYGNHDNPINFDKWLIGCNVKYIPTLETKIGNFIFLNSRKPGSDSGYIDRLNLQHLIDNLEKYNDCIPVIHHHFIPLMTVMDGSILENNAALIDVLRAYKTKIKFCITGHVHNSYQSYIEQMVVFSGLSTCIQYAKAPTLAFEDKPPGFTIYNFNGDTYEVIEKTI